MTKAHGRKDRGTVPEARRKLRKTVIPKGKRGGKAFAVEKRPIQLELFAKTAEAKSKAGKAKTKAGGERD